MILDNRTASSHSAALKHRTSPPLLAMNPNLNLAGTDATQSASGGGAMASLATLQDKGGSDASRGEQKPRVAGERRLRAVRNRLREMDWLWLSACQVRPNFTHTES